MSTRIIIAGQDLFNALQAEKIATVPQNEYGFESEALCNFQRKVSGRGIVEIEIVKSIYGYSVRYASGLQDFGLVLPARGRQDPSLEYAKSFCERWVDESPTSRYASCPSEYLFKE